MQNTSRSEVTRILVDLSRGNRASANKLMPLVYDEFRSIATNFLRQERPGHTLQPTELVHEAYLRLVDYAKSKKRQKRGGDRERITLDENLALSPRRDEDILELDEALNKLATLNTRQARMVELRFFGGLTAEEWRRYWGFPGIRCSVIGDLCAPGCARS